MRRIVRWPVVLRGLLGLGLGLGLALAGALPPHQRRVVLALAVVNPALALIPHPALVSPVLRQGEGEGEEGEGEGVGQG